MRATVATLVAALCLLASGTASSFSINLSEAGHIVRWKKVPIGYYLSPVGSDDISNGTDLAAISASFADWEKIACSAVSFKYLGDAVASNVIASGAAPNGKNEIAWLEGSAWPFSKKVLGVTSPLIYWDGSLTEADIAFNGKQVQWSTTGQFGKADVKSVAIHEIGHYFGSQHVLNGYSVNNPPTMAPTADPYGKTATLEAEDEKVACFLYPAGGTYSCTKDSQCPFAVDTNPDTGQEFYAAKASCVAGKCEFDASLDTGKKDIGELCAVQGECKTPFFCQPLTGGESICVQFCQPSQDECPAGFTCFPYSTGGGACLPADLTLKKNGEFCSGHPECESQLCYPSTSGNWQCRSACPETGSCPSGETCFAAPGYPEGACLPDELVPEYKVVDGDPCNAHGDCQSGICVKNPGTAGPQFCRSECLPGGLSCSFGFACQAVDGSTFACLPGGDVQNPVADGEACTKGAECASGTCHGGICKSACNVVAPTCPQEGQACQRITSDDVGGVCELGGPLELGAICDSDLDCATRFCEFVVGYAERRCMIPCFSGGDDCDAGRTCAILPTLTTLGACLDADGGLPLAEDDATDTTESTDATDPSEPTEPTDGTDTSPPPTTQNAAANGCASAGRTQGGLPLTLLLVALLLGVMRKRMGAEPIP